VITRLPLNRRRHTVYPS